MLSCNYWAFYVPHTGLSIWDHRRWVRSPQWLGTKGLVKEPGHLVYTGNLRTQEVEAGGSVGPGNTATNKQTTNKQTSLWLHTILYATWKLSGTIICIELYGDQNHLCKDPARFKPVQAGEGLQKGLILFSAVSWWGTEVCRGEGLRAVDKFLLLY